MKNVKVLPSKLQGYVNGIASKSFAHRYILAAALSNRKTSIKNIYYSKDILATLDCIEKLQAEVVSCDNKVEIKGNRNLGEKIIKLNAGESGSTLRFIIPIISALGGNFEITGQGRLLQRPNEPLYDCLRQNGVDIYKNDDSSIIINGKLHSGIFSLEGNVSSQYITGLLFALPLLDGDSEIVLTSKLSSKKYVDITLSVLEHFGINFEKTSRGFIVFGNQNFNSKGKYLIEGDWSNIANFAVLGAITGDIKIGRVNSHSIQGDKEIIKIIKKMGGKVKWLKSKEEWTFEKSNLKGISIDINEIPDLTPILAVAGAVAKGETHLKNIKRLKSKESDRVESTIEMLKAVGVNAFIGDDEIVINGGNIVGGTINSYNDHRIVMASTVLGLISKNGVVIENAEAVEKSYPTFWKDINALGGKIIDNL